MAATEQQTFAGRPIEQWDRRTGIQNANAAIRMSIDSEAWKRGTRLPKLISELCEDPKAPQIKALVIGTWSFDPDPFAGEICNRLATPEVVSRLSSLRALFVGDIRAEECEISWIEQGDFGPVIRGYTAPATGIADDRSG
jgi:hypothetical protein